LLGLLLSRARKCSQVSPGEMLPVLETEFPSLTILRCRSARGVTRQHGPTTYPHNQENLAIQGGLLE
jgi:hypothetical protein